MNGASVRAPARKTRQPVKPRQSPGRALYRGILRRNNRIELEELKDLELLRVLLPERAARGIMERLEPYGGLRGFAQLGAGGPRALLEVPGVDEGTAARVLVLWEVAARISEPFRAVPEDE